MADVASCMDCVQPNGILRDDTLDDANILLRGANAPEFSFMNRVHDDSAGGLIELKTKSIDPIRGVENQGVGIIFGLCSYLKIITF